MYPDGSLTSCKELEKTNELSLRYSKTDHGEGWTTDGWTTEMDMGDYNGPRNILFNENLNIIKSTKISLVKARAGVWGQKQVWLMSKSNLTTEMDMGDYNGPLNKLFNENLNIIKSTKISLVKT